MLLGLASSGIHSNGYSLVRRVFADYTGEEVLPELEGKKLKDVLLEPTRIYVKAALPLIKEELVNGIAHITGGGFIENVPRVWLVSLTEHGTHFLGKKRNHFVCKHPAMISYFSTKLFG